MIFGLFLGQNGLLQPPRSSLSNMSDTKTLSFWCLVMMVTKNLDDFRKKMDFGPKNCIFGPKFCIFLRYTYETPIFSGQTHRTGLITCPPYPEVTLDTFGFPVDGRLAARRAVSRPRLPKVALFAPKNAVFGPEIIFLCTSSNFFVTIMTRD